MPRDLVGSVSEVVRICPHVTLATDPTWDPFTSSLFWASDPIQSLQLQLTSDKARTSTLEALQAPPPALTPPTLPKGSFAKAVPSEWNACP